MAATPRSTIDDSYARGMRCAICGAEALRVGHVANLPDYVTCGECSSAFLVEDSGERVFYGQIAAGYPEAEKFALRQWAFAEAIENRARPDRLTLPDVEEEAPAIVQAPPEPEPAPPAETYAEPDEQLADERPTTPYMEFAASDVEAAIREEEPPVEQEPAAAEEPEESGMDFDFLAEIAAEGPAPEPFDERQPAPAEEEGERFVLPAGLAVEDALPDLTADLESESVEPVPGAEPEAEEDFLLGLMAGKEETEPFGDFEVELPGSPGEGPVEAQPEADFLAGLEAEQEPQAAGLIDDDEPHPADTLTPPPWAARAGEPQETQEPAAEEPAPIAWHEFDGAEEAVEEPEPDMAFEPPAQPPAGPAAEIPGEPFAFEAEDDPLGLASAFEALTPDSGVSGAEDEGEAPAVPAWTQFEDEQPAPEEPAEFDAFASLRKETEAEYEPGELEAGAAEPEAGGDEFEPFEFNQRLGAFSATEEEEVRQSVEGPAEDEDDFLSGLRRSAAIPLESEPLDDTPLSGVRLESRPAFAAEEEASDDEPGEDPLAMAARLGAIAAEPAAEAVPEWMQEPDEEQAEPQEPRGAFHLRETDPPPGQRYRVVLLGDRVVFPGGDCAHCGRTPVKGRLAVYGTLPNGQKVGQRKVTSFNVPLCAECRSRAALQTEEAGNARLQAHLISAIIGMVLVVLSLVIGLIDPRALTAADFMILAILLIVGYAGPVMFLLNRAGNYPPPPDAVYVRTTLLVPSETQGMETAFEWRSQEYAQRFFDANQANAVGRLTPVKDRLAPVG